VGLVTVDDADHKSIEQFCDELTKGRKEKEKEHQKRTSIASFIPTLYFSLFI